MNKESQQPVDIYDLFSESSLPVYLKVTKDDVIYAAASISDSLLSLLTGFNPKSAKFPCGELYFRTKDSCVNPTNPRKNIIFRIFMDDFESQPRLVMTANYNQFEKYFFKKSEMIHLPLVVGQKFNYGDFETEEVTQIVWVTEFPLKWNDVIKLKLEEAKVVSEFK